MGLETIPRSLFDAMCAWGDPELVSEMLALKKQGAEAPMWIIGEDNRKIFRYTRLRELLERSLVDKLLSGELVSSGYDSSLPLGQPITQISADLWRVLIPDFDESTAKLGEKKIVGIVVMPKKEAATRPSVATSRGAITSTAATARLVIKPASKEITLDGTRVQLSARLFKLLHLLAEAARDDVGPVPNAKIKQRIASVRASDSVASDAVRELRERLRQTFNQPFDSVELVQNRTSQGYLLNLRPDEVLIET